MRGGEDMTKKDLILKVADDTGIKQVVVKDVIQKTLDAILDALERNEKVELRNFGVFKIKVRKPRIGRNPKTGQEVPIPERKVVVFKLGQEIRKKIV